MSVLGGALPRVGSRLNGVEKEMVKLGTERDWTGLEAGVHHSVNRTGCLFSICTKEKKASRTKEKTED